MNRIHPTAIIGPGVELGRDNVIGPYAVILGPARIGNGNWIGPHVAIGTPGEMRGGPHVAAWDGEMRGGGTVIGDRNVIREFATIQAPDVSQTIVGDDCYIMTKAHIPHDGQLGSNVTVACSVLIGGHGKVGDNANLGLGAVLHQGLVVGPGAMVGMGAVVTRNVPPFAIFFGAPARIHGANRVGMQRTGISEASIAATQLAFEAGETPSGTEFADLAWALDWFDTAVRSNAHD